MLYEDHANPHRIGAREIPAPYATDGIFRETALTEIHDLRSQRHISEHHQIDTT